MFEKKLADKFQRIFDLKKVTFDQPSPAGEQETLFIEVEIARNSIKDGRAVAMITGNAVMIGQYDKIPFGFFSKKVQKADPLDTKDLFFFDIEVNTKSFQNLVQRGFSFIYFFDTQYDPETGSMDSVELSYEE